MKKNISIAIALLLAVFLSLSLAGQAFAQDQPVPEKAKKANPDRISGNVQSVNKETSTISVKDSKAGIIRQIVYTDATKWSKVNTPGGSVDDLKEGTRVISIGKFDDKMRLNATQISIRLPK